MRSKRVPVLCYHMIAHLSADRFLGQFAVPPALFREHLELLRKGGYEFISVDQFLQSMHDEGSLPRRPVLLTFDDCTTDLFREALPILEENQIPAAAFVVTGLIGQENAWDSSRGRTRLDLLGLPEMRDLVTRGIELGAHSRTHPSLPQLSDAQLKDEVAGSVADLEALGFPRPRLFAFPYGKHDDRAQAAVRAAGIQVAFTTAPGYAHLGDNRYQVPRIPIYSHHKGWRFIAAVARAGTPRSAVRGVPWIIRTTQFRRPKRMLVT